MVWAGPVTTSKLLGNHRSHSLAGTCNSAAVHTGYANFMLLLSMNMLLKLLYMPKFVILLAI